MSQDCRLAGIYGARRQKIHIDARTLHLEEEAFLSKTSVGQAGQKVLKDLKKN